MKVICISDTHSTLPDIPKCDLVIHGGDICPHFVTSYVGDEDDINGQAAWLSTKFQDWCQITRSRWGCQIAACWGNHDSVGQKYKNIRDLENFLSIKIAT